MKIDVEEGGETVKDNVCAEDMSLGQIGDTSYGYLGEHRRDAGYEWRDGGWLEYRKRYASQLYSRPMNVYELDVASWKRHGNGDSYSYAELVTELAPYVKQMGYTHIQLLPIEQSFCFSRELMAFVDSMHEAGVGVIIEWTGAYGLSSENIKGEAALTADQTRRVLISDVLSLLGAYHFDGLYIPTRALCESFGTEACKQLNVAVKRLLPGVITVADGLAFDGGCETGFDIYRDMSRAEGLLGYAQKDPLFRKYEHHEVTRDFGCNSMLSISHTEVSGGKNSFLDRMFGDYDCKFAGARAILGYMMTVPTKKLLFMGSEIGQFSEWDRQKGVEWFLLDYQSHAQFQYYAAELNHLYLSSPALWQNDNLPDGFVLVDGDNAEHSIVSYRRTDASGESLTVILNFTPVTRYGYRVGVPELGAYSEVFNSDRACFGGGGAVNGENLGTEKISVCGYENSVEITLPPLSIVVLKKTADNQKKKQKQ